MRYESDKTLQKLLISSPCHFAGEYVSKHFSLFHAWPRLHANRVVQRSEPAPHARSALVAVIRTQPEDPGSVTLPNYDPLGDFACDLLSLLFGKRFDNHGAIEQGGYFSIPDLRAHEAAFDARLPHNRPTPRPDFEIPLQLEEVSRLTPILYNAPTEAEAAFRVACKFYRLALVTAEEDVEVAYLHLITAGEILSALVDLQAATLVDASIRSALDRIEREHPRGARTAGLLHSKLSSSRRRFVAALDALTTEDFFGRSESSRFGRPQAAGYLKALGAAYDVRSHYLRTGYRFGSWVAPRGDRAEERQRGRPAVDDDAWASTLAAAPTLIGLERIIRYVLLRRSQGFGVDLAPAKTTPPVAE